MANSDLVRSLLHGLDLLKLISARPEGVRLNELTLLTGMKKPTLHNLLRTLAARNFVVRDSVSRFRIGPGLLEIAAAQRTAEYRDRAMAELKKLAEQFPDCIITLSRLVHTDVHCIFRVSPDDPGAVHQPKQMQFMPYTSASAIVLQAANPRHAQLMESAYPFEEYGSGMWGSAERFKKILRETARNRYYCRITGECLTAAFVLPDGYALGFRSTVPGNTDIQPYLTAAEKFAAALREK